MGFGANAAAVEDSLVRLFAKGQAAQVEAGDIGDLAVRRRLAWWDVHVETAKGQRVVSGLSRKDADQLVLAVDQAKSRWWHAWALNNAASVEEAARGLELINAPPRYMSRDVFSKVYGQVREACARFPPRWETVRTGHVQEGAAVFSELTALRDLVHDPEGHRQRANRIFVEQELKDGKAFFDSIAASPLTDEQRRAVVIDEDCNLVVAAAGSGKTSVLVAKAAWLISRTFRRPNEMLMLAFASDARDEIKKRFSGIPNLGGAREIDVNTFHGHGLSIVKAV